MSNVASDESELEYENEVEEEKPKKQKISYTTASRSTSDKLQQITQELKHKEENEFERQLRLEREEAERKAAEKATRQTRIDADGTEYEYDPIVKGWFPKVPDEKFLQYQMNYAASGNPYAKYGQKGQQAALGQQQQTTQMQPNTYYLYNGKFYTWDFGNNKWLDAQTNQIYAYVDYMTGISYEWNVAANQWQAKSTPMVPQQQAAAAVTVNETNNKPSASEDKKTGWKEVNEDRNTNVYVTGLPLDTTDEEFETLMSKYGIIVKDLNTNKLKCRLYRNENGEVKGDGRCCYLMPESVKLCMQLLDGSDYKSHKIKVEKAKFEMKGDYDPTKNVKKPNRNKAKEKKFLQEQKQRLLDWEERPEIVRSKHEKVVVIKGLFDPKDRRCDDNFFKKLKEDLKNELEQYGAVKKVILHEKNPEGVATVSFKVVEDADECCQYLDNRVWKNGKIISCETWDGKTRYDIGESVDEQQRRIDEWHKFLEEDSDEEEKEDQEQDEDEDN